MTVTKRKRISKKDGRQIISYQAEIYVDGVVVERKTFPTASAAHHHHDTILRRYKSGRGGFNETHTFSNCLEDYLKEDFLQLRKSSQQARESRLRYLRDCPLSRVKMSQFNEKSIDGWLDWLKGHSTAGNKARRSFKEELKFLTVLLNWYRETKDASFVVPVLRRHHKKSQYKPIAMRVPDYYMKSHEVQPWLDHLRNQRPDPVYYQLGLFMLLTGCRLGEAAGLHWDAIFLDEAKPHVRIVRTLAWDYHTKEAYLQEDVKTIESRRIINLAPILVACLKDIKQQRLARGPVFLTKRGRLLRDNTVRDNFGAAFAACGLQWSGSHIARHTFATHSLVASSDIGAVQAVLGHSNSRQTEQYAKIIALRDNDATTKTAKLLGLDGPMRLNHVEDHVSLIAGPSKT